MFKVHRLQFKHCPAKTQLILFLFSFCETPKEKKIEENFMWKSEECTAVLDGLRRAIGSVCVCVLVALLSLFLFFPLSLSFFSVYHFLSFFFCVLIGSIIPFFLCACFCFSFCFSLAVVFLSLYVFPLSVHRWL